MATQIATADGNLTTAATWGAVDATSLLDSEAQNTALTTSYVSSSVFSPGAITVDAIAVKIATRAASPTGTMSVQLFDSTAAAAVAGTEVTVNVSDIASATLGFSGWFLLKFAAPVLLLAATNYTVQAKTSSATQVNLYRDSTANNWARLLRTTTTGAPAAGDDWHVLGEWTAAATKTNRLVTMDSTATTDYGGGSTTLASISISNGGTLRWGATAATAYILRVSGILRVYVGGVYEQGTTGTPIPSDSSAELQFDCAADGDFGFRNTGTGTVQGSPRTAANDSYFCLLNTDEAAGQTVLGVDRSTGWKGGDDIVIATTSRTPSQSEERVLASDAGASTLTVTVGLTNAHAGTSPVQAEVILLTRNARIRSVSTTAMAYVHSDTVGILDFDWVEVRYVGANAVGKRGVELDTTTGSANLKYCTVRNSEQQGIVTAGAAHNNITIDSCVFWTIAATVINGSAATTGTALTITNCVVINTASISSLINMVDAGWTCTNNRLIGVGTSGIMVLAEPGAILTGTISGNIIHSCSNDGLVVSQLRGGTISNTTIYRIGASDGILLSACSDVTLDGVSVTACASDNLNITGSSTRITVRNGTFAGDTSFGSAFGCNFGSTPNGTHTFQNCTFGSVSGIFVAHTSADMVIASTPGWLEVTLVNCLLASATEFQAKATAIQGRGCIRHQRVDQVTNVHKTEYPALGTVEYDASVFRTAAPSEKLTPSAAPTTLRLQSSRKRIPVTAGKAITAAVYLMKSALYAGSQPRLIMAANPAIGLDNDLVLDTMTAAVSTWEQLSGTQTPVAEEDGVVECYWDCDGSTGFVNGDDWSASTT